MYGQMNTRSCAALHATRIENMFKRVRSKFEKMSAHPPFLRRQSLIVANATAQRSFFCDGENGTVVII